MANNKLLGTLVLDSGKVLETINKVNAALKTLGQGVDLNLTNILNTKVNSQLQELKRQIDEVNRAATGSTASQKKQNDMQLASLEMQAKKVQSYGKLKEAYEKQQQQARINLERETDAWWQNALNKRDQMELASLEQRAANARHYGQEQQRIQQQYDRESLERHQRSREQESRITLESIQRRMAEEQKAAQEQAKIQDWYDKDSATRRQASIETESKITMDAIQNRMKAEQDAEKERARIQEQYDKESADRRIAELDMEAKITMDSIQQRAKAQEEADRLAAENAKKLQDYRNKWRDYAVSAVGVISIAVLKEQWTAAINYATQYYDAQNEIRMVTEMSEADAMQMGQNMRDLAEEMKVTSTDLSKAAITFYRQGLSDDEVQKRLKWVTEYAKVANVDFNEAAQLMTAAVNTMGSSIEESGVEDAVQRIADVWLYLGDNAATSGEEIGVAMQKASASAKEFGLSFEWLGTYIAVVSEQTRQAPEVIGTAFNSMLARMHQIKLSGFNSEDATKVNDVAKALGTLNIELFDGEGKWRDMNLIYEEIAEQWGDMDAKQRALLATTMAGTRQQNVFYALMNDMSKGIEGGSRAWELYEGAMNSAGTASRKYAIYQESIAASQADMKNSFEQLYSNLQPGVIKGFYDIITLIVDGLNNMSIAIPLVIAGITALGVTIKAITASMNPFVAVMAVAASVLGALVGTGGLGALFGGLKGKSFSDFTKEIAESTDKIASLQSAQTGIEEMLAKVQSGATLTTGEIKKYTSALNTIAKVSPSAEKAVRELTSGFGDQATILETLATKAQDAIEDMLKLRQVASERALAGFEDSSEYTNASKYNRKSFEDYRALLREGRNSTDRDEIAVIEDALLQFEDLEDYVYNTFIGDVDDLEELETAIDNYFTRYESLVAGAVKDQSQTVVDDVIGTLGKNLNATQQMYLGEAIVDMLMGDDGTLDYEDVAYRRVREIRGDLMQGAAAALEDGDQYRSWLFDKFSDYIGVPVSDLSEMLMMETSEGDIVDVTTEMMEDMLNLASAGADVDAMMTALSESASWEEFSNKLKGIKETISETNDALTGKDGNQDTEDAVKKYADNIAKISKEVDKIKSLRESAAKGESLDMTDLLGIAETHPEIMAFVGDIDQLKEKLNELQTTEEEAMRTGLQDMILNSKEIFKNSYLAGASSAGYTTLGEVKQFFQTQTETGIIDYTQNIASLDIWINKLIDSFLNLTKVAETPVTTDAFQTFLTNIDNLEKSKDALEVITKPLDNDPTKVASAWKTLLEIFTELNPETSGVEDVKAAVDGLDESTRSAAEGFGELGQAILDSMNKTEDEIKEAAESIMASFADSKAATEGYQQQINQLSGALSSGGVESALTTWKGFSDAMRDGIQQQFPRLITAFANAKKATEQYGEDSEEAKKALAGLNRELSNATKNNAVKYFNDTVKAIDGLNKGTMKVSDAYVDFNKEAKKAIEAQAEFDAANLNFAEGIEVSASDVKNLATYLRDLDPQWILDNWEEVGPMLSSALTEGQEAFDRLNEAAFINITGTSSADFSAIENGLIAVQAEAEATIKALEATGQWELVEEDLPADMPVFDVVGGKTTQVGTLNATGHQTFLRMKNTNPFSRGGGSTPSSGKSSGGGGGGGGGGSKKDASTSEVEIMLDRMEEVQNLQSHSRSMYQTQAGYYSQTGELQGVMAYNEKEIEAIEEQSRTLEENIKELEKWIAEKKKELSALKESDEEYKTVKEELKSLQERHQEYSLALINNKKDVVSLTDAIKEMKTQIRSMQIEVYEEVVKALQARDEKQKEMLEGTAEVQQAIRDALQEQEEKQRSMMDARVELENKVLEVLNEQEEKQKDILSARIEVENAVLEVLEAQKQKQKDMQQGRVDVENLILSSINEQKKKKEDMLQGEIDVQKAIMEVMKQNDKKADDLAKARLSVEKTILEAVKDEEKTRQDLAKARLDVEKTILETVKDEEARQDNLLKARADVENAVISALKDEKTKQDDLLKARMDIENSIINAIKDQKQQKDAMDSATLQVEKAILETIQQQEAAIDNMLNGRISMENTVLGILQAQTSAEQNMLSALVQVQNKIAGIMAAQDSAAEAMLGGVVTVQNTINSILKNQETAQKNLMQGRIKMEKELSGVIVANLNTQKDEAVKGAKEADKAAQDAAKAAKEANDAQIKALREQRDLLDEQLKLRKQQAEAQDKQAQLAELEAQYARISADPTRMKEALEIRKKIADLRDEIAWDVAEKEVEAQKKAIDDQIEVLNKANEGLGNQSFSSESDVTAYWDKIIEDTDAVNRQVEKMLDTMSDAEILDWLKTNDEEYGKSTTVGKAQMVSDWQDMLDEMRGVTKTFVADIAEILKVSDDELMQWLKDNDDEYIHSSAERKKQMEKEWKDQIDAMHGISKSYVDDVADLMAQGDDAIFEWMKANDKEYLEASAESKQEIEREWKEMLRNMHGDTVSYVEAIAEILDKPRAEILDWLKENDETYAQASDNQKERMVKDWDKALDTMYGTTKDYWDEVNDVMEQGLDGFLRYMSANNTAYKQMSKEEQAQTAQGWIDTWQAMMGQTKDYRGQMSDVMSGGLPAFLELMMGTSSYKNAQASEQESMVKSWEDAWKAMNGITKDYEDEAEQIIAQGHDAFIAHMINNSAAYKNAIDEDRQAMVKGWEDAWDAMNGVTKDYESKVQEVLNGGHDAFIAYMIANNAAYQTAMEDDRAAMQKSWEDAWDAMNGVTKDYESKVQEVLSGGYDSFISYMKENSAAYRTALADDQAQMEKTWKDAWDAMNDVTKDYESRSARVMIKGYDYFMDYMITNSQAFKDATAKEQLQMMEGWKNSWRKMTGDTESYMQTINDIISSGYDEFQAFMKENNEAFKNATETDQKLIEENWKDAWRKMNGETESAQADMLSIIEKGREGFLEFMMGDNDAYSLASSESQEQMVKSWNDLWDKVEDITKSHKEEMQAIMGGGYDGFLKFMTENSDAYNDMADTEKQKTVQEWVDLWREMEGNQKDYTDQINDYMSQGHDAFIELMKESTEAYKVATDEEKRVMVEGWEDSWKKANGITKSYEDEANAIIAQGQEAIIATLTTYTTAYQNVGALQSDAYIDEWMEKIDKLKKALKEVAPIEDSFDYGATAGEELAEPSETNAGNKAEEAKKGWRVEANWTNIFGSKAAAEEYKLSRIDELTARLSANPSDEHTKSILETWKSSPVLYYKEGGMAYNTGLAWLDGTPERPERILNPYQTELFETLVRSLEDMQRVRVSSMPTFGGINAGGAGNGGFTFGDIIVNVESLDSDTDYDYMAEHVLDSVMEKINRSAVVGGIRFSK